MLIKKTVAAYKDELDLNVKLYWLYSIFKIFNSTPLSYDNLVISKQDFSHFLAFSPYEKSDI